MPAYGKGQMLGSGINPESFKMDFSGFADAARTQAQGVANLGANIGNAINMVGDEKKAINQNIAKGKSALAFAKANYPELADRIDEIGSIFSDPNVSKADQAAAGSQMGDFVTAMIRGQEFNAEMGLRERGLKIDEDIARARNAPPMPEPFKLQDKLLSVAGGNVLVKEGSDGQTYDQTGQYPVYDLAAFLRGEPPEVYSNPGNTAVTLLDGEATDPFTGMNAQGIQDAADLGQGSVIPSKPGTPDVDLAQSIAALESELGIKPNVGGGLTPRLIAQPEKAAATQSFRPFTAEEVALYGVNGQVDTTTGKAYPIRPPTGMTIETLPGGVFRMVQGAGANAGKVQQAENRRIDMATALTGELNLLEDRAEKMTPGVAGAVGRMVAEQIPATPQAQDKEIIDRVVAMLTLENLQAMRNSNPTGAALGNVSDKDTGLMRASATALSNAQSPEAFKRELVRLKNLQHDVIYGSERVLKQKLDKGEITKEQFDDAMANAPSEYIDKNGAIKARKPITPAPKTGSGSEEIFREFGIE